VGVFVKIGADDDFAGQVVHARRPSDFIDIRKLLYFLNQVKTGAGFLTIQIRKTIGNPFRLVTVPLRQLRRVASKVRSQIAVRAPAHTDSLKEVRAHEYFAQSEALLQNDQPEAAWHSFRECLKSSSEPTHFLVAALCLIVGLGRYKEGVSVFAQSNALRRKKAVTIGLTASRIRFLDHTWAGAFGHIAELDYPIKLGILEGRGRDDTILYVRPETKVPNRFLLEQWRPHLKIVEQEADLPLPLDSLQALCFDFRGPLLADGSTQHYWNVAADVYRRWHAESRKPILTLPPDVHRKGQLALENVGLPKDAWFVALHVREAASKNLHASWHNVLNASIDDYLPAIKEVTRRGGWVIRIGDPAMTPLQPMPNVLDYCHSDIRSDWMDVYLLARARIFLGTSSGPAYVPQDYGVPCVLTNWWPPAQRPWHPQDIFIPKLYRQVKSDTILTLSQSLAEPFGYCNSVSYLKESHGVVVEANSPRDIHVAISEMLDRLDEISHYTDEDQDLQNRADQIYQSNGGHGMASISRGFLKRYSSSFLK
jgi:putative glycosyltransferase (TIGR04372 family)